MEEKERPYIGYKIDTFHSYKVYVNETHGKKYYKVQVKKKNYDGTENIYYKQLRFVKCTPPEDGDIIKIVYAFEDLYTNNADKYNPISVLVIMEYENVENEAVTQEKAYDKFQKLVNENEDEEIDTSQAAELPF